MRCICVALRCFGVALALLSSTTSQYSVNPRRRGQGPADDHFGLDRLFPCSWSLFWLPSSYFVFYPSVGRVMAIALPPIVDGAVVSCPRRSPRPTALKSESCWRLFDGPKTWTLRLIYLSFCPFLGCLLWANGWAILRELKAVWWIVANSLLYQALEKWTASVLAGR